MSILSNGWRQGAIVKAEEAGAFASGISLGPDDKLMIINQDCDVVCDDFDKEPNVEFLILKPIDALDGNLSFGKNPRLIDVVLNDSSTEKHYRCSVHGKSSCSRHVLETTQPDHAISIAGEHLDAIRGWLAARYTRDAFPDAFNHRLPKKKLNDAFKRYGKHVSDVLIGMNSWDELDGSESYEVAIYCTMRVDDYADSTKKDLAERLIEKISAALDAADGINLAECELRSEADVSLDDYRMLKAFRLDHLSYADAAASASAM